MRKSVKSGARKHQVHIPWPFFLVPRFIDVELFLAGQNRQQALVSDIQAARHLAADFAELPATDRDSHHVPQVLADRAERAVAGPFEIADQGRHSRADESRLPNLAGNRRDELLVAFAAEASAAAMLRDFGRLGHHLDLLHHAGRLVQHFQFAAAFRAGVERIILRFINLVGLKRGPLVLGMPRLAASLFLLTLLLPTRQGRLDNVRRRRLGRIGRILARCRQLRFQHNNSPLQLATLRTDRRSRVLGHDGPRLNRPTRNHQE